MSKESHCTDIPKVTSVHCFASFPDVTQLKTRNASALAAVFRERAPFCNYKSSFPFSLPADQTANITNLAIAGGTGNAVELKSLDLSSLSKLRSLYIEERCFQHVSHFTLHGLPFLQSVFIEDFCFAVHYELCSSGNDLHRQRELSSLLLHEAGECVRRKLVME